MLGPYENGNRDDGRWGFFFEIEVIFPSDAPYGDSWRFIQGVKRTEYFIVFINGVPYPSGPETFEDPTDRGIAESERYSGPVNGRYYWIDLPNRWKRRTVGDRTGRIDSGFVKWEFTVQAINVQDSRRSCIRKFSLTMTITNGEVGEDGWSAVIE